MDPLEQFKQWGNATPDKANEDKYFTLPISINIKLAAAVNISSNAQFGGIGNIENHRFSVWASLPVPVDWIIIGK